MNNNAINDVLQQLKFTDVEKKGFLRFLRYARVCQETESNKQLKSQLSEIVKEIVQKQQ